MNTTQLVVEANALFAKLAEAYRLANAQHRPDCMRIWNVAVRAAKRTDRRRQMWMTAA